MKKKIKLIVLILIIIATVIAYPFLESRTPVQVAKVTTGNISEYINQRAITSLPDVFKITMPFDGRIEAIQLSKGSSIKKGEVAAKIVPDNLQTELQIALSKIEQIEGEIKIIQYNDIWNTAKQESADWINAMKAIVDIADKKVGISKNLLDYSIKYRDAQILSGMAVSVLKKAEAEMDVEVNALDMESSELTLKTLQIVESIFKMLPIYIDELLAIRNLNKLVLESQYKQAQEELAFVKRNILLSEMRSPIDGIILERYVQNQMFLPAGTELLDIGNLDDIEVTADVLSTDISNIELNDKVELSLLYDGSAPFNGMVIKIEPQGFTKTSSLGVEEQRVNVKISINNEDKERLKKSGKLLGYKYRVFTKIITAHKENVLIIPRTALTKNQNGDWVVFQAINGKAAITLVKIGLFNDDIAEVTNGLKSGDSVIIAPPSTLQNGTKINI